MSRALILVQRKRYLVKWARVPLLSNPPGALLPRAISIPKTDSSQAPRLLANTRVGSNKAMNLPHSGTSRWPGFSAKYDRSSSSKCTITDNFKAKLFVCFAPSLYFELVKNSRTLSILGRRLCMSAFTRKMPSVPRQS